jgi:hypothetical protein
MSLSATTRVIIMGHDGPVTMWERYDDLYLKAEIRI